MRKFFPRLFNLLAFLSAILVILPWYSISLFFSNLYSNSGVAAYNVLGQFFYGYEHIWKTIWIPLGVAAVSLLYLVVSAIDRGIKSHNKKTTKAIKNAIYGPLYMFGISASLLGIFLGLFQSQTLTVLVSDWFGLGAFLAPIVPSLNRWIYIGVFAVLFLVQLVLALFATDKLHTRSLFGRLLMWIVFGVLAFVSYKAVTDSFAGGLHSANLAVLPLYITLGVAGVALILYVIIAIARAHKNNIEFKAEFVPSAPKETKSKKVAKAEKSSASEEFVPNVTELKKGEIEDPLFVLPTPEEVVETVVEEKTIIKQVIFEKSDLNEIFETDFGFKNCTMVRKEGVTDYFVNKQKFLSLFNNNHAMSFRLELDKAIRLIIQYPLIGKDKYENHKIWFKIDDISILNKDTVADIVKEAYNTVLNNQ